MHGKGRSRGVRHPGYKPSVRFVELGQAFAIFFMVRIVDPPRALLILGTHPTQNRYLPLANMVWFAVCTYSRQH